VAVVEKVTFEPSGLPVVTDQLVLQAMTGALVFDTAPAPPGVKGPDFSRRHGPVDDQQFVDPALEVAIVDCVRPMTNWSAVTLSPLPATLSSNTPSK